MLSGFSHAKLIQLDNAQFFLYLYLDTPCNVVLVATIPTVVDPVADVKVRDALVV